MRAFIVDAKRVNLNAAIDVGSSDQSGVEVVADYLVLIRLSVSSAPSPTSLSYLTPIRLHLSRQGFLLLLLPTSGNTVAV